MSYSLRQVVTSRGYYWRMSLVLVSCVPRKEDQMDCCNNDIRNSLQKIGFKRKHIYKQCSHPPSQPSIKYYPSKFRRS